MTDRNGLSPGYSISGYTLFRDTGTVIPVIRPSIPGPPLQSLFVLFLLPFVPKLICLSIYSPLIMPFSSKPLKATFIVSCDGVLAPRGLRIYGEQSKSSNNNTDICLTLVSVNPCFSSCLTACLVCLSVCMSLSVWSIRAST